MKFFRERVSDLGPIMMISEGQSTILGFPGSVPDLGKGQGVTHSNVHAQLFSLAGLLSKG